MHDQVCFFYQQSAETYLKALLEACSESLPKTHDLETRLDRLVAHHPDLRSYRRGMQALTGFAVATRYPGADATKRQARTALNWANRVEAAVQTILGPATHQGRRKKKGE